MDKFRFFILTGFIFALTGCVNDDRVFTQGRIEDLCNESIPVCNRKATCLMGNDEFFSGQFPSGQYLLVRTEFEDMKLIARFLLDEMTFPGTEMLVKIYTPDCSDFEEDHPQNVDLFDLAGDDRIIEFELDAAGRGDHLVEIFSDMSASYKMTLEVE